jgi:hypothetical protein
MGWGSAIAHNLQRKDNPMEPAIRYASTADGVSIAYADRGETMLKGFEDAVRLFEVRWRE